MNAGYQSDTFKEADDVVAPRVHAVAPRIVVFKV